jgi:UDP-3-O-[3-hydroxymyristoyl] N-acetylglucosamine deacetylase
LLQISEKQPNRQQQTLKNVVSFSGIGIHSGLHTTVTLKPALPNTGIQFQRTDLDSEVLIPANANSVHSTQRCTVLAEADVTISTVEHLLATLKAFKIDNLLIQVSNAEIPILDGSALEFIKPILEAGIEIQDATRPCFEIKEPLYVSEGNCHIIALPAEDFKISYTLHHPKAQQLLTQYGSLSITKDSFIQELAGARTFAFEEDVKALVDMGLIKGGSLDNAIVIGEEEIYCKGGLRYKDEMLRHKILDIVGDISLTSVDLHAHIIAVGTGHRQNCQLAKQILNLLVTEMPLCK